MTTDLDTWLAQTKEEPIDPDLPICDPHHHLSARRNNTYLLDELLADLAGHNIVSTVYVECSDQYRERGPEEMQPVGETEFVHDVASQAERRGIKTDVAAGIIGFADLTLGDAVTPVLEAQMAASKRFKGIRYRTAWDESPEVRPRAKLGSGIMMLPEFRQGFARLRNTGLVFDAWLYHNQIPELVDLARQFPEVPVNLNHVGTPIGIGPYAGKRDEVFGIWKKGISELADCSNVTVKLGGLAMTIPGFGWDKDPKPPDSETLASTMAPYFDHCLEKFGVGRCMFEGNFPVDKYGASYVNLWNAFKRYAEKFSPTEKAALFHDTAARSYKLI